MQSHSLCPINNRNLAHIRSFPSSFYRSWRIQSRVLFDCSKIYRCSYLGHKIVSSRVQRHGFRFLRVRAMDEDFGGFSPLDDWGDNNRPVEYILSSSEGEDSDGEIILQPITDVDLPQSKVRFLPSDDSITATAHRFAMLGRAERKRKTLYGILNNIVLVSSSIIFLLLVDQCAWRIVRLPLQPFHLLRPFLTSVIVVSCVGYICVPLFSILKLQSISRKGVPSHHSSKKGTPTMGGLYFVPIGLLVAVILLRFSSIDVSGVVIATIAFAAIGLLDDFLRLKNHHTGLPSWVRILLQVAVGIWFSHWIHTADISTPYSMKMVVPLPAPVGLVNPGKFYPILTSLCFVSMANGIDLTDGLDGLAAGTAALSFIGMSIVVLPICSDLAVFGASMAGACIGFLFQNHYKASIFMGDTGALALGGALAAMASCTGMFFPLFISSGILILEALSVIVQVSFFKATKIFWQRGYRLFRMAPFHHHLELCGIKEPVIVAAAYAIAFLLMLFAAYVGLISA